MCSDCQNIVDETCPKCTAKESETELCDACFSKKLERRKLRKQMKQQFSI